MQKLTVRDEIFYVKIREFLDFLIFELLDYNAYKVQELLPQWCYINTYMCEYTYIYILLYGHRYMYTIIHYMYLHIQYMCMYQLQWIYKTFPKVPD